jgi:hypothetical protein
VVAAHVSITKDDFQTSESAAHSGH